LVFNSILIATSTCVAVPETNLLLNPGAEQGQNELPSFWREAAIGADGLKMYRDDGQAHSGKFSFAISNTHKYPQTVCNNWAQNIMDVPAGKTVRLSAYIKTEEADSVNVCLQCWAAENNMLAFASTPVFRETQDWVLVQSQPVVVPPHTSYICVRAVLTGLGKAWFDDISLAVIDTPTEVSNDNKESEHIIDQELVKIIIGNILPITKDCMVLSYMPNWQHGNVDNIAIANNDGGVRTLLAWPQIKPDNVNDPNCTFLIALYSRKTTSKPPAGIVEAYEILKDWPERTSWETRPSIAEKPAAKCKFVPGKGWKLFDITPLIRGQLQDRRKCHGLMLRFAQENRSAEKNNWSGYAFVSREGLGQWLSRRPRLLIVKGQKERKAEQVD
jgi:hypothetical protein